MNFGRKEFFGENWSQEIAAETLAPLWTFTVPVGAECEIIEFGNYMGTVAQWGQSYFYATQNGVFFELAGGFPYILDQVGYAAQRQKISPKRFAGGTVLTIYGYNADPADANDMGISIGYYLIYQE